MSKRMDRLSRREQIAEEALKLAAKGVSAITVSNVAKACGIVPAALYRHYKNKDEIFDGVRELIRKKLIDNAKTAMDEGETPLDVLRQLGLRHAELLYSHPGIPRLLFSEAALGKNSIRRKALYSLLTEYRAAAADIAAKGQELGQIRKDLDPADIVFMLLGTVVPPSFLFHISSGEFDPREQVKRNLQLFEETIAVKKEN
ncbi:TetR/AcrR family transcriptional regulator [Desulfovibrio sp. JC022]|uniref:TetR/AcrR family transcriptional regulator n=1 Tax=Desulfovibrio sp. JC022 TaxID=2593642 RepID=UPI0013D7E7A9|nr:TetR/AcrR family transcriptional regulator [Desulfovibrio sp. JC022]NDV21760.1 TetR/AcrR family transcriptional regulator [Desulfovibrio sp. JC022]